jgi:hypothetical protein
MVTFRDLYGLMTPERRAEVAALREKAGLRDVKREDAEAALFGGGGAEPLEKKAESAGFDEFGDAGVRKVVRSDALQQFDPAEIERGVALNAAVILTDARPEKIAETRAALLAAFEGRRHEDARRRLERGRRHARRSRDGGPHGALGHRRDHAAGGPGHHQQLDGHRHDGAREGDRHDAGGRRAAQLHRGALRGRDHRARVPLAGGVGALCAAGGILLWGKVGLPAQNAFMTFLFSGPRLYPTVTLSHLLAAVLLILFFALISTLYPAALAARILPRVAMSEEG